jgi:DNA/RNA-binding domain of Phe-tRNA-synthetase-like protein
MVAEPQLELGWIDENLRLEFPELRLVYTVIEASPGRTPAEVKERLRVLSNRFTGPKAIALRQQPIPWAYRVFFRHVGIDPDEHRTPVEAYALERMRAGGFKSRNVLDDALTIATIETGVPVIAFDEDRLSGPLGLRLAREDERLGGEGGRILSSRQVLIADADRSVGVLFADMAEGVGVDSKTRRMRLASIQVKGVPDISVEEALWTVVETLQGPPDEA